MSFAQSKRAFTIEDLYRVKNVGDLALSPDGRMLAFTVTTSDLPHAKRTSNIWVMDVDGKNAHALTQGSGDSTPRFSPDGKQLAFLRDSNLYLLPLAGGEAKQLTAVSTGVSDPLWSPDGKWIAFATDVYPECGSDDACNKKVGDRWSKGKLQAHMADNTLLYRHWTEWRDGKVTHTFLANAESGDVRDVTPGNFNWPPFSLGGPLQYAFSPDSKEMAVSSNHDPDPASSTNSDLWLIDITAPKPNSRNITAANKGYDNSPQYSPDGRWIAYRTQKTPRYESELFQIALYDRQSGTSKVITPGFNNWIDDYHWTADSKSIVFSGEVEGHNPLFRVDIAGGAAAQVWSDQTIDAFEIGKNGRDVYYIHRSVGEPSEVYSAQLGETFAPSRKKLSTFNRDLMNEARDLWVRVACPNPRSRGVCRSRVKPRSPTGAAALRGGFAFGALREVSQVGSVREHATGARHLRSQADVEAGLHRQRHGGCATCQNPHPAPVSGDPQGRAHFGVRPHRRALLVAQRACVGSRRRSWPRCCEDCEQPHCRHRLGGRDRHASTRRRRDVPGRLRHRAETRVEVSGRPSGRSFRVGRGSGPTEADPRDRVLLLLGR